MKNICYLKIPGDLCNWLSVQPLPDDSLNIPISQFTHIDIQM